MNIRNYLLLSISTILLASCSNEAVTNDTPAEERIPLRLQATLSADLPVTRAVGSTFADDDEIISNVQHVVTADDTVTNVTAKTLKFTKKTTTAAYWDDFSESSDASKDLRTDKHGLRSYYGYCYNGGSPVKDSFKEAEGELKWTIAADQTEGIKKYDLLWSPTQKAVTYSHAKDSHGTLSVPFTHAMSKFTIVVVAGDGFEATDLDAATVTLHGMNEKGTFTAPIATVAPESTTVNIDMYGNTASTTDDQKSCRAFEAIAVPQSDLSENKHLATITMAGNTYKVIISSGVLTSWTDGINDSKSKNGYNYKLTVTLNKQAVAINATLSDWDSVSAEGTGEIQFANDVTEEGTNDANLKKDDKFRLYWKASSSTGDYAYATTAIYDDTSKSFANSPAIFWPNGSTSYYFRALSGTDDANDTKVAQGNDVLWGTSGDTAIAPRTGTVPLTFSHAMSKVNVTLTTSAESDASHVDLTEATVELTNIKKAGTIAIATGVITASTEANDEVTISGETIMVPQTIDTKAKLVVTLKDGTTYSLALNKCTVGTNAITTWESGKSYTYTIHLEKEDVKFRAVITPWVSKAGSGNATLDWD